MRTGLVLLLFVVFAPRLTMAQDLGDLAGSIDVSHVDATVNDRPEETWRQLYTLNWYKQATDYINVRAGLRYYKFDLDAAEELFGTFQEEVQPSGELAWKHPLFTFTATAARRISRSPAISGQLINDSVLLNWESAWSDSPVFGLRYESQNLRETGADAFRDVNDQRFTASVDYDLEHESFEYQFRRVWNENVIRGLNSSENQQRFHYLGGHDFGARRQYQLSTQYRYSRVDRVSEVETGQRFLERVDPAQGLGGIDATPDLDPLPVVPGLIDGNTLAPVVPPLDIGAGDLDRNVGVDLGARRDRVAALYVYTDRLSAATVTWTVWISDDNLAWDSASVLYTNSAFNPTLSRYEIEFNEISTRYIKVVNSGVNTILDVQVTEVEVFESRPDTEDFRQDASSHLADARLAWTINAKWQASVDAVARLEPSSGSLGQRLDYNYALRTRYQARRDLAHVLRWAQSWQEFEESRADLRDDTAGYSLLYDPLATLGTNFSMSFRQSEEGGETTLRSGSALVGADATPWRSVRAGAEFGVSRIDQPVLGYMSDSWNTRFTVDTDITRQLRALGTWLHQESRRDGELRVLRRGTASAELQVTSAIFARGSYTISRDLGFSRRQDYLLSWRLFVRLLLTGQATIDDNDAQSDLERYSVNATLDLFDSFLGLRNVTVYVRFSDVDQRGAGGSHILSWQQGLRAAF